MTHLAHFDWQRDQANPVLPPNPDSAYDCTRCMNPFVVRVGDEYRLYYSGGDAQGRQRICLATAAASRPTSFTRHGVVLNLGKEDAFDSLWCVLPCVYRFGDRWRLHYTGRHAGDGGLQSFTGIGLATSDDGVHFEKHAVTPVITGDQTREFPGNQGVAGGGTIIEDRRADGSVAYRMYYTLAVGTPSPNMRIDQEKHCAVCHSTDGIHWTDHRLIMSPRRDVPSEDVAVAAPFVWRDGAGFRMLYCGIGTRWGYYSISEAASDDGYHWRRGEGDSNLSLTPGAEGTWEGQMVEYPSVIEEDGMLRLFYCGDGYGATGIGTAVAARTGVE